MRFIYTHGIEGDIERLKEFFNKLPKQQQVISFSDEDQNYKYKYLYEITPNENLEFGFQTTGYFLQIDRCKNEITSLFVKSRSKIHQLCSINPIKTKTVIETNNWINSRVFHEYRSVAGKTLLFNDVSTKVIVHRIFNHDMSKKISLSEMFNISALLNNK